MQRKNENIDRLFKHALEGYRAVPEDVVWQRISERLAERRKKRSLFLFTRIAAGIALVSALGFILYFVIRDRDMESPALENIASTSQNRPVQPQQNIAPAPEYPAPEDSQGFTGTGEEGTGPATDSPQEGTGPVTALQQEVTEHTTTLQQEGTEQVMPGRLAGPVLTVPPDRTAMPGNADNSTQTNLRDQTVLAVSGTGVKVPLQRQPLSLLEGIKTGNLPVLDGQDGLQEDLPGEMTGNYLQTSLAHAAESERITPVTAGHSWALGGAIAPFYSYRRIASDDLDNRQLTRLNDAENGILAYAGGLNVSYAVSGRFSIQSGLYYSRYGQEKELVAHYHSTNLDAVQPEYELAELDGISITNSTGFIANSREAFGKNDFLVISAGTSFSYDDLGDVSAVQYFDFLEFPLVLSYKLIDRRMDFSLMGGVLASLLVGNRVYLKQDDVADYFGKTLNIRSVNYVGTVGFGVEYSISGNFTVNIEPRFGYYLRSIDASSEIRVHPYSFGIYSGVSYRF